MDDIEERRVGNLTVRIDRLLCVGFGDCMEPPPPAFVFDAEGVATFVDSVDEIPRAAILDACEACPVDAISVVDGDGHQLVP